MIRINQRGKFKKTMLFLDKMEGLAKLSFLDKYGQEGVAELANATPKDSGLTSDSWYYEIHRSSNQITIMWKNSNVNDGLNIALLIQYGHGTRNGGYVAGINYINPALDPIIEKIQEKVRREITQ